MGKVKKNTLIDVTKISTSKVFLKQIWFFFLNLQLQQVLNYRDLNYRDPHLDWDSSSQLLEFHLLTIIPGFFNFMVSKFEYRDFNHRDILSFISRFEHATYFQFVTHCVVCLCAVTEGPFAMKITKTIVAFAYIEL